MLDSVTAVFVTFTVTFRLLPGGVSPTVSVVIQ